MPECTVHTVGETRRISFSGTPVLHDLLLPFADAPERPCGGRGRCGKCAVYAKGGLSVPPDEQGKVLSCQAHLTGDAEVWLPRRQILLQIETGTRASDIPLSPMPGDIGAAVDIGTTTVVLQLIRLSDGEILSTVSCENPQRIIAADVIGRIEAALKGQPALLKNLICGCVDDLEREACARAGLSRLSDVRIIAGNTTMLYLYSGRSPKTLASAPFEADCLFGFREGRDLLVSCAGAFVGGDITCAILSSRMQHREETALLIDVGTNGEIALWHNGVLRCCATAAGPAFEGGGISCGCGSIRGAIDRVSVRDGQLSFHTLEDAPVTGLCGSGLIDLTAALLETEQLDETGYLEEDVKLADGIALTGQDIRQVQLAKGAIAAGIRTLMSLAGITADQIGTFYIAGGFGSHLNLHSAARIGLFPAEFIPRARVLGNASLSGARQLLLSMPSMRESEEIAGRAQCLNAAACPGFSDAFVESMLF